MERNRWIRHWKSLSTPALGSWQLAPEGTSYHAVRNLADSLAVSWSSSLSHPILAAPGFLTRSILSILGIYAPVQGRYSPSLGQLMATASL